MTLVRFPTVSEVQVKQRAVSGSHRARASLAACSTSTLTVMQMRKTELWQSWCSCKTRRSIANTQQD